MRIKTILSQHRRDFYAVYECDHCGHETGKQPGYDDANFHQNVIPSMKCPKCGQTAKASTPKTAPTVPAHVVI